jgi:hemerythrin superfamily protein
MELGAPDKSGRRSPVAIPGSEFELPCEMVIEAVGTRANPLLTETTPDLKLNPKGNIVVDAEGMTSMPGVFAGGDIVRGAATVILAMGDGKKAAAAMDRWLRRQTVQGDKDAMDDDKMTISAFFSKDHDEIDAVLSEVDFTDAEAAYATLREFDHKLERHIVWEEEILFPAAGRAAPQLACGPIAAMRAEHAEIRALKAQALERLKDGDAALGRTFIEDMLAVLSAHNMKEEHMLYPACDLVIAPGEIAQIIDLLKEPVA